MPTYATNKKAYFTYSILEKMEAGLKLSGAEVKSIRSGHVSLKGAYITFHGPTPNLLNAHIPHYPQARPVAGYDPTQTRIVLLNKKESAYLREKLLEKGLTAVPLTVYTKGRYIKLEIGLARGKKTHDKRAAIKDRDNARELRRAVHDLSN